MKLSYIVNLRIPTEKAHGYQICKMCEEFAGLGIDVELITPTRKNSIEVDLFEYYGLRGRFKEGKIRFFGVNGFHLNSSI